MQQPENLLDRDAVLGQEVLFAQEAHPSKAFEIPLRVEPVRALVSLLDSLEEPLLFFLDLIFESVGKKDKFSDKSGGLAKVDDFPAEVLFQDLEILAVEEVFDELLRVDKMDLKNVSENLLLKFLSKFAFDSLV